MKSNLVTHSRMQSFLTCPRLHRYQYVDGIRPVGERSEALSFGTLMHKALEAWWKHKGTLAEEDAPIDAALFVIDTEDDPYVRARARVLMCAYSARWEADMAGYEVLGVEQEFQFDTAGLEMRRAGKIDAIVRRLSDGTLWGIEHKTSGADLSPGSAYWTSLRMDGQVSLYHDGIESLMGEQAAGIIYDVIEKPDIRPLKATPEDQRKYTQPTKKEPISRLYANQREHDETPEEFEARLTELVAGAPERYLQRAEVIRMGGEMEWAREDVRDVSAMIQSAETIGRHPRNTNACKRYGRVCEYLPLCEGTASVDDEHLYQISKIHPELG